MSLGTHDFSFGIMTPVMAYFVSVVGSFLGLRCTVRVRAVDAKAGWLGAAAVAIGGTGFWGAHFIAMLGFTIDGASIRYSIPLIVLSAVVAMAVVGVGLYAADRGRGVAGLLAGGVVTGGAVAAMHYVGMVAMHTSAEIHYRPILLVAALVIAVVGSCAALWLSRRADGQAATAGAAAVLGLAVIGTHYTAMAALTARAGAGSSTAHVAGVKVFDLVTPLVVVVGLTVVELLLNVDMDDDEDDVHPAHQPRPGRNQVAVPPELAGLHAHTEVIRVPAPPRPQPSAPGRAGSLGSQLRPPGVPHQRPRDATSVLNGTARPHRG